MPARSRRLVARIAALACCAALGASPAAPRLGAPATGLGCSRTDAREDGRVAIRLSGYAGNPAETDLVRRLVADFNASQTEIHVTYEPVPGQYYPKMLTMLVADTAPDVFYLDIVYFRPFLSKKILLPLDALMAKTGTEKADFIPALLDAFTDDGKVYGIPKDFNSLALFYDKDVFDAAGIPYPDTTWDLERLREVAKQLTRVVPVGTPHAPGGERHGFALTHDDITRFVPIARMFGASLFGPDGKCALGGPEGERALRYYAGLEITDRAAIYPSEVGEKWAMDVFGKRSAAMVFEGSWMIPYLADSFPDLRYGATELPKGPAGRSNFLFTVAYVIPRSSKHPEAAWKLIEYLTSEKAQAQVTIALPSRKAASAAYVEHHPEYQPVLAGTKYAEPFEFGTKGDRIKDRLGVMVQEVFLGAKGEKSALHDACAEIDQLGRL